MKVNLLKLGETYVATVDGSYGTKGFVTDVIADKESFDLTLFIHVDQHQCLKALKFKFYR